MASALAPSLSSGLVRCTMGPSAAPRLASMSATTSRHLHTSAPVQSLLPWARRPSTRNPAKARAGAKRTGNPQRPPRPPVISSRTIFPLLAKPGNTQPPPVVPGDLRATLDAHYGPLPNAAPRPGAPGSGSATDTSADSTVPDDPIAVRRAAEARAAAAAGIPLPEVPSASGPYLRHGIGPREADLILRDLPAAQAAEASGPAAEARLRERAEMVAKVVSLDNAGAREMAGWNIKRVLDVFGRGASDTGSPEVQAAVLTVRMQNVERHLSTNTRRDIAARRRLDDYAGQRRRILLYLRRTNLPRYVETCKALGIDPNSIIGR